MVVRDPDLFGLHAVRHPPLSRSAAVGALAFILLVELNRTTAYLLYGITGLLHAQGLGAVVKSVVRNYGAVKTNGIFSYSYIIPGEFIR